jgi:threonine dehydrogenase-like Zn-dependent dehydrogenase
VNNAHYALTGPQRVERVHRPLEPLRAQWVRVRIAYCGLCGTDMSQYHEARPVTYPVTLGHEWVGTVEASRDARFAVGDVVATDLNFRCGRCPLCRAGRSHLCANAKAGRFSNRGFALRADIHASYLQPCSRPPAPQLALAEPLSCARHALAHCRIGPEDRVLVVGAGSLGLCVCFLLAHESPARGFEVTDPQRGDRIAPVIAPRGRTIEQPAPDHYDVVIDVSGAESGLQVACDSVARGGRLCSMSHLPPGTSADFFLHRVIRKDITINFSYLNGEPSNLAASIRLLERAWTAPWDALLDVRPLEELPAIFRERLSSSASKVVVDASAQRSEPGLELRRRDPVDAV